MVIGSKRPRIEHEPITKGTPGTAIAVRAAVAGDYIIPDRDIMYYIEAVDDAGSGSLHPAPHPTDSIPYHAIKIER